MMSTTTTDQNKTLVRRAVEEVMNKHNSDALNELLAPDFMNYDFPMQKRGPNYFNKILESFLSGFPDMHLTIEQVLAEGDMVATRGFFTGTHMGTFQGILPTGKEIKVK